MRKVLILAQRELAAYVFSPLAYVIGAIFLLASALWFFHAIFIPGGEASLRPLFEMMAYGMIFVVPLLTMRLLSEEYRTGTIETLLTAPIEDAEVILGKFLGVLGFYLAMLAATVVFLIVLLSYGCPDWGVTLMGYLGMVLLGAAYVSVGLFTSTLTRHQLLASILAIAILAFFALLMQALIAYGTEPWDRIGLRLSAMTYFSDFAKGIFDARGLVYFLTGTALFLFLSVKTLESKRWRA
jgi:ABC-2 type transport system permease protein